MIYPYWYLHLEITSCSNLPIKTFVIVIPSLLVLNNLVIFRFFFFFFFFFLTIWTTPFKIMWRWTFHLIMQEQSEKKPSFRSDERFIYVIPRYPALPLLNPVSYPLVVWRRQRSSGWLYHHMGSVMLKGPLSLWSSCQKKSWCAWPPPFFGYACYDTRSFREYIVWIIYKIF